MKTITLKSDTLGTHCLLYDDSDHDLVSKYKWYLVKERNTLYARTNSKDFGKRSGFKIHQLIMGFPPVTDHIDRNGLNNCRSNLRPATVQQNNRNSRRQRNNTTGYKGVDYNKNHKAFRARVNVNRKSVYCRYFKTAEEAARAYNEAAIKHYGEFAALNQIP